MEHALVYYGGGEVMAAIADAMAAILNDQSFCKGLFRIIGLLGTAWCSIRFIYTRSLKETFSWFAGFIILTSFAYTVRMNIRIIDKVSGFSRRVDNVPWIWAKPAFLLNSMSITLAQKMDTIFQALPQRTFGGRGAVGGGYGGRAGPSYLPYYETGSVFASRLISKARHFRATDPTFNGNLERFVNQCVVFSAMIGNRYTMKDLRETDDLWELVKTHASPVMGFSYRNPEEARSTIYGSEILTCREGALKLEAEWDKQLKAASLEYGKSFFPNRQGDLKVAFLEKLPQSYHVLSNISKSGEKLLQQSMMINALRDAPNKKLSEMGSPMNYAAAKTMLQQRSNFTIAGEVAQESLPIIKVVLEALTYASFIFVFFIGILPNGFRVFKTYFEMLLSLQLWPLLYTILNFIMTIYARWQTESAIGDGLNLSNMTGIAEINADIAAYAGYWSMLVPIFAYMITRGGVSSMVQAAGQIGNAFMSASSSVAHEVSSGNISLGNMQYGTQSIMNTSGFKHDTSFMERSSQMETMMDDGTSRIMHGDGSITYKGADKISQMGLKVSSTDHMSKMASDSLSHSEGVMQTKGEEWSKAEMATASQMVAAASAVSESINSGKAFDVSEGYNASQSLQNVADFAHSLQNKYGISSTQANQITAGLSVGGKAGEGVLSLGLNSGFDFKNQAERQAVYDEVNALAEKYGITDSFDKTQQSLEKIHFADQQSKEARLTRDASSSFQESESLRESYSKARQEHDSLSNLVQTIRSGSLNIEWDENQNLLDYVAEQKHYGHRIGHDTAYKMISRRDPVALSMIEGYQKQQWEKMESSIRGSDHVLTGEEIKELYQKAPLYEEGVRAASVHVPSSAGLEREAGSSMEVDNSSFSKEADRSVSGSSLMKKTATRPDMRSTFKTQAESIVEQSTIPIESSVIEEAKSQYQEKKERVMKQMDQMKDRIDQGRVKTETANKKHMDRTITGEMIRNMRGGIDKEI